jgi:hypothetical protein
MPKTPTLDNVVPLKKRRRARTNEEALQFMREAADESGVIEVATIADLRHLFQWEKDRTWKAVRRWAKEGKNRQVETTRNPDTGHVRIRVLPDREDTGTGQSTGQKTGQGTGHPPVDGLDKISNQPIRSNTSKGRGLAGQVPQNPSAQTQMSTPSEGALGLDMSSPKSGFWRWRRRRNLPPPPAPRVGTDCLPLTWNDRAAWVVAVGLAFVSGGFSVHGLAVIFPGLEIAIEVLGILMECGKLILAGWLGQKWHVLSWLQRVAIVVFLSALMSINAAGLYSQLVAAHVGPHGEIVASNEADAARITAEIEVQETRVANLKARLAQLDQILKAATDGHKANTANNLRQGQTPERTKLATDLETAVTKLARLKKDLAEGKARGHVAETKGASIQYLAQFIARWPIFHQIDAEEVVRWIIAAIVFSCDPLAVFMMAMVHGFRRRRIP